jgi:hypothetical protein
MLNRTYSTFTAYTVLSWRPLFFIIIIINFMFLIIRMMLDSPLEGRKRSALIDHKTSN